MLQFLSTLSLRRATSLWVELVRRLYDFYPRSPCGERRKHPSGEPGSGHISIHALLAESDTARRAVPTLQPRFLSTLSLRRATKYLTGAKIHDPDFYPRSPCGERLTVPDLGKRDIRFLSTLSLRRATVTARIIDPTFGFLSTLSLRRATDFCGPAL